MSDRCLVDTNVFVYAADVTSGPKSATASRIIERLSLAEVLHVTPQVALEFFNVTVLPRGRTPILSPGEAVIWVDFIFRSSLCMRTDEATARDAVRAAFDYQMNIYDAHLWAAARRHRMDVLLTEDLPGGRSELEGVRYVNPFEASFKLEDLSL